jgi:hypothetical protein
LARISKFCRILAKLGQILAKLSGIWHSRHIGQTSRNLAAAGRCLIPTSFAEFRFMPVGIFSYKPNAGIYFQENYYFFSKK